MHIPGQLIDNLTCPVPNSTDVTCMNQWNFGSYNVFISQNLSSRSWWLTSLVVWGTLSSWVTPQVNNRTICWLKKPKLLIPQSRKLRPKLLCQSCMCTCYHHWIIWYGVYYEGNVFRFSYCGRAVWSQQVWAVIHVDLNHLFTDDHYTCHDTVLELLQNSTTLNSAHTPD